MKSDSKCLCNDGYWLQKDKHTCVDVDECKCMSDLSYYKLVTEVIGTCEKAMAEQCEHSCENLPGIDGQYQCKCRDGYLLHHGFSQGPKILILILGLKI